jgi:hypothetical protein
LAIKRLNNGLSQGLFPEKNLGNQLNFGKGINNKGELKKPDLNLNNILRDQRHKHPGLMILHPTNFPILKQNPHID